MGITPARPSLISCAILYDMLPIFLTLSCELSTDKCVSPIQPFKRFLRDTGSGVALTRQNNFGVLTHNGSNTRPSGRTTNGKTGFPAHRRLCDQQTIWQHSAFIPLASAFHHEASLAYPVQVSTTFSPCVLFSLHVFFGARVLCAIPTPTDRPSCIFSLSVTTNSF